jgi:glycosyltransferase involved in cell wall biosynthesis
MTGFLAPPSDPGALSAAMLRLMDLPDPERRRMGERGREHIRQRYGLARVVEEWEQVYREASARRGVTSPRLSESPGVISDQPVSGRQGP